MENVGDCRASLKDKSGAERNRYQSSFAERFRESSERDRRWLLQLNLSRLNDMLWILYIGFICLNFLDIFSTILAINSGFPFYEKNFLAARLFSMHPNGFVLATAVKYAPALPLFYAVFHEDIHNVHQYQTRLVKAGALAALIAGNIFYFAIVFFNNIPNLLAGVTN